jgi:hypothetical protein
MIQDILNTWLASVQTDLIKNYDRLGLRASGRWANSLEPFTEITDKGIRTGILGQEYTGALENGRRPTTGNAGTPTLREEIRIWIDQKGITPKDDISKDSLAFLIARKIHREGIKVPNKYNAGGLVSDVVTRARIKELSDQLSLFYIESFSSNVIKEFK